MGLYLDVRDTLGAFGQLWFGSDHRYSSLSKIRVIRHILPPPVSVQKRLRQASLDAELFGSDHAKRARISSPQTDYRGPLEGRSPLRQPRPYPGTVKSGSTVGIGTLGDGQGTVVDSIWSGHKEDKVAITPRRAVSLLHCCCAYDTNVKHHSSCTRLGRMRKEPQVLRPLSCGRSQRSTDRVLHVRIPYLPDTLLP